MIVAALAAPASAPAASLDPAFGTEGRVLLDFGATTSATAGDLAIQPDGKIVAVGWIGGAFGVVRLLPTGALDPSFGTAGVVLPNFGTDTPGRTPPALALQPDGRIVIAGPGIDAYALGSPSFALMRLNPDGSLDTTFGQAGKEVLPIGSGTEVAEDVAVQPDGKIVVAGFGYPASGTNSDFLAVRLTPTGRFDTSFGSGGLTYVPMVPDSGMDSASAVAVLPDGKVLLAGVTARPDTGFDLAAVRLASDGSVDPTFGSQGRAVVALGAGAWQEVVKSLLVQSNGAFLIGGAALQPGFGPSQVALARLTAGGGLDPTFAGSGMLLRAIGSLEDTSKGLAVYGSTTYAGVDTRDAGTGRRLGILALDSAGQPDVTVANGGSFLFHIAAGADEHAAGLAARPDGTLIELATVRGPGAVNDALGFAAITPRSTAVVPPPPTPDETKPVAKIAPASVVTAPRNRTKPRRVAALGGTAKGSFGVDRVDVALVRVGRRCDYLVSPTPRFRTRARRNGGCPALVWKRATGRTSWTYRLGHRLPRGSYVLFSRATGRGLTEVQGKVGSKNRSAFSVR